MTPEPPSQDRPEPVGPEPANRFEATVHPGLTATDISALADLDLDRIPGGIDDPDGVRVLVSAGELTDLMAMGYEVRLQRALPLQPLNPDLITSDLDAALWLDDKLAGIDDEGDS